MKQLPWKFKYLQVLFLFNNGESGPAKNAIKFLEQFVRHVAGKSKAC